MNRLCCLFPKSHRSRFTPTIFTISDNTFSVPGTEALSFPFLTEWLCKRHLEAAITMPNHHHRTGGLSQSNKKNKRSRASKRSVSRAAGGRVNVKAAASINLSAETKANRRHQAQQRRDTSRQSVLQKRRGMLGGSPPPRVVGIISLAENTVELEDRVRTFALRTADQIFTPSKATMTAKYNVHKKDGNLTFLTSSSSCRNEDDAVMAALDLCRLCDVVLFVIDGNGANPNEMGPMGMQVGGDDSISTRKDLSDYPRVGSSRFIDR